MFPSRPLNLHLVNSLDHSSGRSATGLSAGLLRSHHWDRADSRSGAAHPLDYAVGHSGQVEDDDSIQDRQGHGIDQRSQTAVVVAAKPSMSVPNPLFTLCE
jgi:hypothetical protein